MKIDVLLPDSAPEAAKTHGFSFARVAAAVPDFLLALVFLITWIAPYTFGERVVAYLLLVMLLEFIIIHSAGFMGSVLLHDPLSRSMKIYALLGFGAFYALFAGAFSVAFEAWWPLWTIAALTLNRLLIVLFGNIPRGEERAFIRRGWAVSALVYLLLAFATIFLNVPRFGITPEVVRAQALPGGGIWIEEPHRVLAFGFCYFLALAVSEAYSHRWLPAIEPRTT